MSQQQVVPFRLLGKIIFRVANILKHEAHFTNKLVDSAILFYTIWLEVAKTATDGMKWKSK
jgi:hypothetical protein